MKLTETEIEEIIREAEENPGDELFNNDINQDLTLINKIIKRYGTIATEDF